MINSGRKSECLLLLSKSVFLQNSDYAFFYFLQTILLALKVSVQLDIKNSKWTTMQLKAL